MTNVFSLVDPVHDMDTYTSNVNVFTKQANHDLVLYSFRRSAYSTLVDAVLGCAGSPVYALPRCPRGFSSRPTTRRATHCKAPSMSTAFISYSTRPRADSRTWTTVFGSLPKGLFSSPRGSLDTRVYTYIPRSNADIDIDI